MTTQTLRLTGVLKYVRRTYVIKYVTGSDMRITIESKNSEQKNDSVNKRKIRECT